MPKVNDAITILGTTCQISFFKKSAELARPNEESNSPDGIAALWVLSTPHQKKKEKSQKRKKKEPTFIATAATPDTSTGCTHLLSNGPSNICTQEETSNRFKIIYINQESIRAHCSCIPFPQITLTVTLVLPLREVHMDRSPLPSLSTLLSKR